MKLTLLTFGGGSDVFRKSAKHLEFQARQASVFANVVNVTDYSLNFDFDYLRKYRKFVRQNKKGYGYWIWKPYLIYKFLNQLRVNELLIYLDAGCYLNLNNKIAKSEFIDYLELAHQNNSLAGQIRDGEWGQDNLSELAWSRLKLIETVELSDKDQNTNQIQAGWQIYRKNSENLNFVRNWLELCESNNFQLIVDAPPNEVNHESFIEHRHDQSIFSCLYKKNNKFSIQDDTWWDPNWNSDGKNYPIWAMRASRKLEFISQSKI